jgi:transposase
MAPSADSLPTDLASAHAMIIATREALLAAQARASAAESEAKHRALLIEKLKYTIAKLRHDKFGQSSERGAILEQLELALAEMEEDAAQAETAAQMAAAAAKIEVRSFERRKPARRPLPEHLPRERIVYPAPAVCPCCGGALHKIGEDVTETLEPHPTPVEGDPARAREVLLPLLQKHHPAAGVIASDLARGRAGPLLPARPKQQASRATSGQLCRPDAGRCVCRLQ